MPLAVGVLVGVNDSVGSGVLVALNVAVAVLNGDGVFVGVAGSFDCVAVGVCRTSATGPLVF